MAIAVADPLLSPKHATGVDVAPTVKGQGSVTVALPVAVQPVELSVTVTLYVPAGTLVALLPLLTFGNHWYTRAPVLPVTVKITVPLLPPKQGTLVTVGVTAKLLLVAVMVTLAVAVQPFASVIVGT